MKMKLLVTAMLMLAALALVIGGGLLGALLEFVGVWVYGWEATGTGYACGIAIGAFCVCVFGWVMVSD